MAKLVSAVLLAIALLTVTLGICQFFTDNSSSHDKNNNTANTGIFGRGFYQSDVNQTHGKKADPNYLIQFPRDHAAHPNFDIEWWYLTANLKDQNGELYGLQWTLFRFRNPFKGQGGIMNGENTWSNNQIYMAHASVHSIQSHWFKEKFARGGVGNAGTSVSKDDNNLVEESVKPFSLFIDNWQWQNNQMNELGHNQGLLPATLTFDMPLIATDTNPNELGDNTMRVNLSLEHNGLYVRHGVDGYSIKSGNSQHASHYYSAPFIKVKGSFTLTDKNQEMSTVLNVTGTAWFDQEWTSQLLDSQTAGWDWMSLHLSDGSKLMAFRMRLQGQEDYVTGSLIRANGKSTTLQANDIILKPKTFTTVDERKLPLTWQVKIPSAEIDITVKAVKNQQWNPAIVAYYEGMVNISGTHSGEGFLELTGY